MNILLIMWKEIKIYLRDFRTFLFMLAFPIALILILGTALSNAKEFDTKIPIDDLHVLYHETANHSFSTFFAEFKKEAEKSGIHLKKLSTSTEGQKLVQQGKVDGYIEIHQHGVKLYVNSLNSIKTHILQGVLTVLVDQYNLTHEIAKINPHPGKEGFLLSPQEWVKERLLRSDLKPSSMGYYSIVITTMFCLFPAFSGAALFRAERTRHTGDRLLIAPLQKWEIVIGKFLGGLIPNLFLVYLLIAFSIFVLGIDWGEHLGFIAFLLFTEVFLGVSLGLAVGIISKTESAANAIVMTFIQLASFFGGAYFKIDATSELLGLISQLSPLTWINQCLQEIIYLNDLSSVLPVIFLNIGISLLILILPIWALRRREGL